MYKLFSEISFQAISWGARHHQFTLFMKKNTVLSFIIYLLSKRTLAFPEIKFNPKERGFVLNKGTQRSEPRSLKQLDHTYEFPSSLQGSVLWMLLWFSVGGRTVSFHFGMDCRAMHVHSPCGYHQVFKTYVNLKEKGKWPFTQNWASIIIIPS